MVEDATVARWIELSRKFRKNSSGPRVLPIAKIGEAYYFVDERVRQLRNVVRPDDFVDFETDGELRAYIEQRGEMVS
jgi:hypothetical protein